MATLGIPKNTIEIIGIPSCVLMERAAYAVAMEALDMLKINIQKESRKKGSTDLLPLYLWFYYLSPCETTIFVVCNCGPLYEYMNPSQ